MKLQQTTNLVCPFCKHTQLIKFEQKDCKEYMCKKCMFGFTVVRKNGKYEMEKNTKSA